MGYVEKEKEKMLKQVEKIKEGFDEYACSLEAGSDNKFWTAINRLEAIIERL